MSEVVSTGNGDLDKALGVGGLPIGTLTELHGLSIASLSAFVTCLLNGVQPSRSRMLPVSIGHGQDLIHARVSRALQDGAVVLAILPEDTKSAAWISEREMAEWLHGAAELYGATILCAIPMTIRVNSTLTPWPSGLARLASLRLQIQADPTTGSYHISVVKNTLAAPFGEATYH